MIYHGHHVIVLSYTSYRIPRYHDIFPYHVKYHTIFVQSGYQPLLLSMTKIKLAAAMQHRTSRFVLSIAKQSNMDWYLRSYICTPQHGHSLTKTKKHSSGHVQQSWQLRRQPTRDPPKLPWFHLVTRPLAGLLHNVKRQGVLRVMIP